MKARRSITVIGAAMAALVVGILATSGSPVAADTAATKGLWTPVEDPAVASLTPDVEGNTFTLAESAMGDILAAAPLEGTAAAAKGRQIVSLPSPDGGFQRFAIQESPVMAPELAVKYPQITTYSGVGIDDPTARVRLDNTPAGFHAQVLSTNGDWYIDPHSDAPGRAAGRTYLTYDPDEHVNTLGDFVEHGVIGGESVIPDAERGTSTPSFTSGAQLHTYRLAVAATGEYTTYHGGTVQLGLAAVVTAINRVTGIYEIELAARLELVANNDDLIYTNPATDPYSNSDPGALLDENQANLDSVLLGDANYDVGHVFSTGGGGLAALGVIGLSGYKAQGETGASQPTGDYFWVDYVAHELGHQFGGNHTFVGSQGSCSGNINSATAMEPGSGTTIQAYAGICGNDDLATPTFPGGASDPNFHAISFDEIQDTMDNVGQGGTVTSTGNAVPTVSSVGGSSFTIPQRTPFVLTASGNDADAGDVLTYSWEQMDAASARPLTSTSKGVGPLFRSYPPTTSTKRYFPKLSTILAGNTTAAGGTCPGLPGGLPCWAEYLPTEARSMTFRGTVRDNVSPGGGVSGTTVTVTVDGSGPFQVTSQAAAGTVAGRSTQTVTWDVAGTATAPISTPKVDIFLSTDGGATYPITLASNVANDGSQDVVLPDSAVAAARIMVRGHGNIFFDINDADFAITQFTGSPTAPRSPVATAGRGSVTVRWIAPFGDGGSAITKYTVTSSPDAKKCTTTGARTCTVTGLTNGTAYRFTVKATNASGTGPASVQSAAVTPRSVPSAPRSVTGESRNKSVVVSWRAPATNNGSPITKYTVTASPGGRTCTTTGARTCTVTGLANGTAYRFTVRAKNAIGTGPASTPSAAVTPRRR